LQGVNKNLLGSPKFTLEEKAAREKPLGHYKALEPGVSLLD